MVTSVEEKERVLSSFRSALQSTFASAEFPTQVFSLTMNPPIISKAAVFFMYEDPSGTVARIRSLIQAEVFPRVKTELGTELFEELEAKIPNIIHSTFVRFKEAPRDPVKLENDLRPLLAEWKPVAVDVPKVTLAIEDLPYMHVPVAPGSVAVEHQLHNS